MTTINDHLKRYPHARSSTLAYIAKRNETTAILQREIEAKRPKPSPLPWWKRLARAIAGRV